MAEEKKWYESKTMWLNIAAILGGVITIISGQYEAGIPITVASVINAILRVISEKKITF